MKRVDDATSSSPSSPSRSRQGQGRRRGRKHGRSRGGRVGRSQTFQHDADAEDSVIHVICQRLKASTSISPLQEVLSSLKSSSSHRLNHHLVQALTSSLEVIQPLDAENLPSLPTSKRLDLSAVFGLVFDTLIEGYKDSDDQRSELVALLLKAIQMCSSDDACLAFKALHRTLFERSACIHGTLRTRLEHTLSLNAQMSFDVVVRYYWPHMMNRWFPNGIDELCAMDIQCWSLRCIVAAFSNGGDRALHSNAAAMFELLLGIVPRFVTESRRDPRYIGILVWGLRALLAVIGESGDSVEASITSFLWIVRRCMTLGGGDLDSANADTLTLSIPQSGSILKRHPPSSPISVISSETDSAHESEYDSDLLDGDTSLRTLEVRIRLACQQCLQAAARSEGSLFSRRWASLVPSNVSLVTSRSPFGGASIVTILQFDPSDRVRAAAAAALQTMIEFSPMSTALPLTVPSSSAVTTRPTAFTSSSRRNLETVLSLHKAMFMALQACRSRICNGSPSSFAYPVQVLKATSTLLSKCPYSQLSHHSNIHPILVEIASSLQALLELVLSKNISDSYMSGFTHELFSCLCLLYSISPESLQSDRSASSPDPLYDCASSLIPVLLQIGLKIRSAPNAVTVLTRLTRSRSPTLVPFWTTLMELIEVHMDAFETDSDATQAMLRLLEQWLSAHPESLLSCPGAFGILLHKVPLLLTSFTSLPSPLRARALLCICELCSCSWASIGRDRQRQLQRLMLKAITPDPGQTSVATAVAAAACRCLAVVATASINDNTIDNAFIEDSLNWLISNGSRMRPLSVRQQALWSLAELFSCSESAVLNCVNPNPTCLWEVCLDGIEDHDKLAVSALRLCTSLLAHPSISLACPWQRVCNCVRERVRPQSPAKIRWNACRTVRALVSAQHVSRPLLATVSATLRNCNHDKVRLGALGVFTASNNVANYGGAEVVCLLGCSLFERAIKDRHVLFGAHSELQRPMREAFLNAIINMMCLLMRLDISDKHGSRDACQNIKRILDQHRQNLVDMLRMWEEGGSSDPASTKHMVEQGELNAPTTIKIHQAINWLQSIQL